MMSPTRKNETIPSIKKIILKMKFMMEVWLTNETIGGCPILTPTGKKGFLFLIIIREEITQVLMNKG